MTKEFSYNISVRIAAPPDHVWPIMVDVENWNKWTPSVRKIRRFDKGALAVGSKALIFQPRLPPALWRVTSLEHGRSFTWISSGPGVSVTARHQIEPLPEGSMVTLAIHYNGFLAPVLARLTATLNDRYLGFEAEGLKKQSEHSYVR